MIWSSRGTSYFPICAITLVGLGLRIWKLGEQPLWTDEGTSWAKSTLPLADIWTNVVTTDAMPPLYYWLLRLLAPGSDEADLRAMSVFFGTAAIPLVWSIGRVCGGLRSANVAALFVAVSPLHILYSQEARHYALFEFLAAVSILGMVLIIRHWWLHQRDEETVVSGAVGTRHTDSVLATSGWIAYVIGTSAALWTHNTAVFLLAATNVSAILAIWQSGSGRRWSYLKSWGLAQGLVLLIWSLWSPGLLAQVQRNFGKHWIQAGGIEALYDVVNDLWAYFFWGGRTLLTVLLVVIIIAAVRPIRRYSWAVLLLCLVAVSLLCNLVISIWSPMMVTRSVIWVSFPLLVLLAIGLTNIRIRWISGALLMLILLIQGKGLWVYWHDFTKERWGEAIRYVEENRGSNDGVAAAMAPWVANVFRYYWPRYGGGPFETVAGYSEESIDPVLARYQKIWLIVHNKKPAMRGNPGKRFQQISQCTLERTFDGYGFKGQCESGCIAVEKCQSQSSSDNGNQNAGGP